MKKIMCILVFLAVASMSMAAIAPVTSVVKTDAPAIPPSSCPQKLLQSITVGADTFSTLKTGTTTQNNVLVPRMDDWDLNTAFTGYTYVSKTVLFGGGNFVSTNGSKPDFFFFEATALTGNPETCSVAAIFTDDSLGAFVALATPASWGNTGLNVDAAGPTNPGQRIFGTSFDITDLKTAAGAALASNAVIKGIAVGPTGTGIDPIGLFAAFRTPAKGEATTPVPSNVNQAVDGKTLTQVSWSAPVDPNIVSVTGYDVWLETHEPNDLTDTRKSTNQPGLSYSASFSSSTTYYWRVDTHVTWTWGTSTVKGPVWQFTTLPPVLTFKNVVTTLALSPAALSATVTGNTSPITSVLFELLTPGATLTDTTTDYQNPTATLATTSITDVTYQVKLTVTGATPTPLVKTVSVKFYADACAARKDASLTPAWSTLKNYYDTDSSCFVNVTDLLGYTAKWLNDTTMKTQETYAKTVTVLALDVVVECENAYAPTDPNYTTQAPLEVNAGAPSIGFDGLASGGMLINNFGSVGNLLTYQVTIPQTGSYTLYLRAWHEWNRLVSFDIVTSVSPDGNPANDTLTHLVTLRCYAEAAGAKWYLWTAPLAPDTNPVNLTAGTYLIRMTKTDAYGLDPDFFGFKKNF
jgi:hypothetical protein